MELDILEKLEATSSSTEKKKILKANSSNKKLQDLLNAAFDYKRKFFIKKFDIISGLKDPKDPTPVHSLFLNLLSKLESRSITGDAAVKEVESFLIGLTKLQQKWYARVLRKDLRAGFSVDTANSCGFSIPVFEVQLATDGLKCKRVSDLLRGNCVASRKLDGYRCIIEVNGSDVTLFTRNGLVYENFPLLKANIENFAGHYVWLFPHYYLDGEIMSDDFNSMQQSAFASKRGTAVGRVKFWAFDLIPGDEWEKEEFVTPYKKRLEFLNSWFEVYSESKVDHRGKDIVSKSAWDHIIDLLPVGILEHVDVSSMSSVMSLERDYIAAGFEGVMVKPNIPYYRGRSANKMLKFKTMKSMECEVYDVYEGTGKHEGRLGGVRVKQENSKLCDVGSGFTDEDRQQIWDAPDSVIGRIIEVKYQDLSNDGVMRFPVMMRYRKDKE